MSKLKNGTWVLIADGEKALFLENVTDGEDPHLQVVREKEQDNPPTREQAANRPGRVHDSSSGSSRAYDDTDWHELEKDRFAADLADILFKHAHEGAFESLVIVAAPSVLGTLRDALHSEVSDKVIGEIDKTLTNHPLDEIEKIVKNELSAG